MDHDDHDEVLRLRERVHELVELVGAIRWQTDDLREWRREVRETLDQHSRQLLELVKSEEIADAIADRMRRQHTLQLTLLQKLIAGVVAGVAFADGIRGLVS